ncbi:thiopeptide-type bacteriocin biosynthesis protein [Dysgonomonas sp. ZJ279]|uniref:thiopeptide-type bacteriocin biosynthesis protein n=1 Tax=Dysgonomonas sp. ZJ279 TaxID=2709796 RepID=UPI0013ED6731|nr:thiopeptide-type bacteriocin biosynthesis protein [Dysgonomonas sp. ZJ279]
MTSIQRTFTLGNKWVYIKLYTGIKTAEDILIQDICFIINRLQRKHLIGKWFFIRYADPDFHLRIRIWVKNEFHIREVINLFQIRLGSYIENNLIWKVQLDTYNRELERYGNILMEESESIFYLDSVCILSIIKILNNNSNEDYRWMIALKMIDCFLSDFSLNNESKLSIISDLNNSFKTEFGFNEYNSKQFNLKFRSNKNIIEGVLRNTITDENFLKLNIPIKKRSKELAPVIKQLNIKLERNKIDIPVSSLLSSYIHMTINRLFRSKNRLHELILYDFMYRYYTSEIARNKYKNIHNTN